MSVDPAIASACVWFHQFIPSFLPQYNVFGSICVNLEEIIPLAFSSISFTDFIPSCLLPILEAFSYCICFDLVLVLFCAISTLDLICAKFY
jgi:hypothetical protein